MTNGQPQPRNLIDLMADCVYHKTLTLQMTNRGRILLCSTLRLYLTVPIPAGRTHRFRRHMASRVPANHKTHPLVSCEDPSRIPFGKSKPDREQPSDCTAGGRTGRSALSASHRSARLAMSSKQSLLGQIDAIGAEAFHILLVEDDELTLKVTEGLLRHCNYQGTARLLLL